MRKSSTRSVLSSVPSEGQVQYPKEQKETVNLGVLDYVRKLSGLHTHNKCSTPFYVGDFLCNLLKYTMIYL